jgi:hypothetical protein
MTTHPEPTGTAAFRIATSRSAASSLTGVR